MLILKLKLSWMTYPKASDYCEKDFVEYLLASYQFFTISNK